MSSMQMPICIRYDDNFWEQLIWDKDLSDTTLVVQSKDGSDSWEFAVHSIVLRRRSTVFKQLITKLNEKVTLETVDIAVLTKFIKYLYVGDVFVESWSEIVSLLELAKKYEVTSLLSELENSLTKFITLINVCQMLDQAVRLNLKQVTSLCISLIVRSAVVVFSTGGFQRLSEGAMFLILSDDRLNITREVDALLALICWVRNRAFLQGVKMDASGVFEKISSNLLKAIRLGLISDEEKKLLPDDLVTLIFTKSKNELPEAQKKARVPSKDLCLLGNFAFALMRRSDLPVSWQQTGHAVMLAMRFSFTMPVYLGGFLTYFRCNGKRNAFIEVRDTKKDKVVKHILTEKNCEHTLVNEPTATNSYVAGCFELDTPLLVTPGEELSVHMQLVGANIYDMATTTYPSTTINTGEGPQIKLHIDKIYAIRKVYFMSACGRCSVSPFM